VISVSEALDQQYEALLQALRTLVFENHPDIEEVARRGDWAVN